MKNEKWQRLFAEDRSFTQRLMPAFCVSLAFAFTFLFFGPSELYIGSREDFIFSYADLLRASLPLFLAAGAVMAPAVAALRGKIYDIALSVLFGVLSAGYIQCNFLNGFLGRMDGSKLPWEAYLKKALLNLVFWTAVCLAPVALRYFQKKIWTVVIKAGALFLIAIQAAGLVSLLATHRDLFGSAAAQRYYSTEGIFDLSAGKNVVVFVLDTFDNDYLDQSLAVYPDRVDFTKGFTYFPDAAGRYYRTFPAIDYLLTGEDYQYDVDAAAYKKRAWENGSFLQKLKEMDYDVRVFSDELPGETEKAEREIDNYHYGKPDNTSYLGICKGILRMSGYRYAPVALKPSFWFNTVDINNMARIYSEDGGYVMDDAFFYYMFKKNGLKVGGEKNAFRFYHLYGAHPEYTLDENGNRVAASSLEQQVAGILKCVGDYVNEMRDKGVFENSTIIITADHGYSLGVNETYALNPVMLIKPAGIGDGVEGLISAAPVSHEDFQATILKEIGADYEGFGVSMLDIPEGADRERKFYYYKDGKDGIVHEYVIRGNANDFSNWKRTGAVYPQGAR